MMKKMKKKTIALGKCLQSFSSPESLKRVAFFLRSSVSHLLRWKKTTRKTETPRIDVVVVLVDVVVVVDDVVVVVVDDVVVWNSLSRLPQSHGCRRK